MVYRHDDGYFYVCPDCGARVYDNYHPLDDCVQQEPTCPCKGTGCLAEGCKCGCLEEPEEA